MESPMVGPEFGACGIAVIGMGCVFPGNMNSPEALWQFLREGRDAISEVPRDRWNVDAVYDPVPGTPGKTITRWGGFVEDIRSFDAAFFRISPREAALMDPQQRLLLEFGVAGTRGRRSPTRADRGLAHRRLHWHLT